MVAKAVAAARKKATHSRCEHCGGGFQHKRATARFCSSKCRVAAHRAPRPALTQQLLGALISAAKALVVGRNAARTVRVVRDLSDQWLAERAERAEGCPS